ncbi:hypothetical protein [Streptomyces sp. CCM_MD2014]|uniref:hypothetical protein n=1 Tax=Streptomyces sp. CCM_MD2014 TaxID=1561022 RepID=UPI0011DCCB8C|nr:hypothetical protein [Streptomyces sp. CCM_MD2014]
MSCEKYPDHPLVRAWNKPDPELAEMARAGHLKSQLQELTEAGYEIPEEFNRGAEDPPPHERIRLFFERYDLSKHFPSEGREYPKKCTTRKLSDDELRQRREYAEAVRESRSKKGNHPDPLPPWEKGVDPELAEMIYRGRAQRAREREAKRAARIQALRNDQELARKMREALETWVNRPRRVSHHTTDVREGYGNAVPEFEEPE